MGKDCFSQLKERTAQCSVFIHDLERVNEFLRLNSHVKFLSNKVEVAGCLHLSRAEA